MVVFGHMIAMGLLVPAAEIFSIEVAMSKSEK
jgi:hypothetical protein